MLHVAYPLRIRMSGRSPAPLLHPDNFGYAEPIVLSTTNHFILSIFLF